MKQLCAFIFMLLPTLLFAHPGHGETEGFTIKHYMVEPEHVIVVVLALAVTIFFLGRKKEIKEMNQQKHP